MFWSAALAGLDIKIALKGDNSINSLVFWLDGVNKELSMIGMLHKTVLFCMPGDL